MFRYPFAFIIIILFVTSCASTRVFQIDSCALEPLAVVDKNCEKCEREPHPRLHLRLEYLTSNYLASKKIHTPYPSFCFNGQQVVVFWSIPRSLLYESLILRLSLRFGDHSIGSITAPLNSSKGVWIYRLLNNEYRCKKGIISFKGEIENSSNECIAEWKHHIWAEPIGTKNSYEEQIIH